MSISSIGDSSNQAASNTSGLEKRLVALIKELQTVLNSDLEAEEKQKRAALIQQEIIMIQVEIQQRQMKAQKEEQGEALEKANELSPSPYSKFIDIQL